MIEGNRPNLQFWRVRSLPVILQTEAAECGLAAIAMVATYWGLRTDLAALRRRFSVSMKGMTLRGLLSIAHRLDLQARPLKVDLDRLRDLRTPCVLHWDFNHFVVLKCVRGSHVTIHDPAVGERRLELSEASKHFTGVALELSPSTDFAPGEQVQRFSLVSLMGRVVGLRRSLAQLVILAVCLQVCLFIVPFYLQWVVDEAIVAGDHDLLTVLGVGFLLLVAFQSAIGAVRSWVTAALATNLNFQWLGNAFSRLTNLPLSFFEKRHLGDVISRFGSIQTIQQSLTKQAVEAVIDGVLAMATIVVMALYSATLTVIACAVMLVYALVRWAILRPLREATAEQIVHAARQSTHLLESVRGLQSIRLFNREEERRTGWLNVLTDQFNAQLRVARLTVSHETVRSVLFNGERVVFIWLAAYSVIEGRLSVGMLFALLSYKELFIERTGALIDKVAEYRMLRLHGERVADIVLAEPEQDGQDAEVDVDRLSLDIELCNVRYRYGDGEPYVLDGVTLHIPFGQSIAITGASGCGKTTLVKLLLGLLEPCSGEIRVGGVSVRQLGLRNYRRLIGAVMQDDQLFAGTIAENVTFFDATPNKPEMESCTKKAGIHAEICQMPMAYNTLVGDAGTGLSSGQRQRILLARALYRSPQILVLDEATSHLDVANERIVNSAIKHIDLTRIVVAHRPETIAMSERVVVLDAGTVVSDSRQPTAVSIVRPG